MSDPPRTIELEIEVPGTPEEVWRAIATGPGISSWYVPHQVEERAGGTARASFGAGPEMEVDGRVVVWEPPHRIVLDGGEGDPGLAFEWLVEARDGGSCVVRLVNTGFGEGGPWDDQYDDLYRGWQLFMANLRLHLEHFAGRTATAALPMTSWQGDSGSAWRALAGALGLPVEPTVGERVRLVPADGGGGGGGGDGGGGGGDGVALGGTVLFVEPGRVALLLDEPAPGTGFIAAEGHGGRCALSVWAYLYGEDRDRLAAEFTTTWQRWLDSHLAAPA